MAKVIAMLLGTLLVTPGWAASLDAFEGPETSWQPAGGDARYRLINHRSVHGNVHGGLACEQIGLVAYNGSAIYFSHPVPLARVINELTVGLWVRSSRPGIQILVRVVLPRTRDPHGGGPLTTFLSGPRSTRAGSWEPLRIAAIPRLLERQVRVLRNQLGPHVDPREAYVDQVLLNVYTGPGPTTIWIDDLDITSLVGAGGQPAPDHAALVGWAGDVTHRLPPTEPRWPTTQQRLPATEQARVSARPHDVRLEGTVLMAGGRPTLARGIDYRGEPLPLLKRLGFNMVRLASPASPRLLAEAQQAGIWLISPPPDPDQLRQRGIGSEYGPVIAWDMGRALTAAQRDTVAQWARELARQDPRHRPLLGTCKTDLRAYSRILSILVTGRDPLGTSLELSDYARWMGEQSRLALPGIPIWTHIQTQPRPRLLAQIAAMPIRPLPAIDVPGQQIRQLGRVALAAGARGLLFESISPLTGTDPTTQDRAATLELINLQLTLLEPWLATAAAVTQVPSSDPTVTGALIDATAERARLLIPVQWQRGGQFVYGPPAIENLSLVVPGVPESNAIYAVSLGGIRRLRHRRVAGGIRIWLDRFDAWTVVLITQDPLVLSSLSQRIAQTIRRADELLSAQAARKMARVLPMQQQLAMGDVQPRIAPLLTGAGTNLQRAGTLRAAGDYGRAYDQTRQAMLALDQVQRLQFEHVVQGWGGPVASPLAVSYATLPAQLQFARLLRAGRAGSNRLPGGQFEDLARLRQVGWHHYQHPIPGVRTTVELAPGQPYRGRFSLRLRVAAAAPKTAPHLVATPPVWVTSPPVAIPGGQLLRIRAWVRVTELDPGATDGLLVIDSLAGEALATRIGATDQWQEVTLYRVAAQPGPVTITFALSSYGQADIDEVTVTPIGLPRKLAAAPGRPGF